MKNRPIKLFIGIDPAFRQGGFLVAIIDRSDNTVNYISCQNGFIDFYKWFNSESPTDAIVCIENSNLQNTTFNGHKNKNVAARMSRDAGKNQAISQITVDLCKTKYKVIDLSPKSKGKKWTNKEYKGVLKSEGLSVSKKTSNQDERDALKLALIAFQKRHLAK